MLASGRRARSQYSLGASSTCCDSSDIDRSQQELPNTAPDSTPRMYRALRAKDLSVKVRCFGDAGLNHSTDKPAPADYSVCGGGRRRIEPSGSQEVFSRAPVTRVQCETRAIARLSSDNLPGGVMSGLDEQQLASLVNEIVGTYSSMGTINHLGHDPLPDTDEVIAIARDLKEVLFPGYHRNRDLRIDNVNVHISRLLDSVHVRLTEQIARAQRSRRGNLRVVRSEEELETSVRAAFVAEMFLKQLPQIRSLLESDVQAAFEGDPAASSIDEIIFCYPGVAAITNHRLAHALYRLQVPIIPRVLSEWSHRETGIDIHPGATIGPSFFIDHGTGVVVGETCEIGSGVTLYQSVTLGAWSFPRDESGNLVRGQKRHPTIENSVVIYSNATVLGGTTVVGANSSIGAGVSLSRSVPANTIVTIERPQPRFREAI